MSVRVTCDNPACPHRERADELQALLEGERQRVASLEEERLMRMRGAFSLQDQITVLERKLAGRS